MIWAVIRQFSKNWHPLVETMQSDANGRIRKFHVKGDKNEYVEILTYFSDSEHELAYEHISGIAGVDKYKASIRVTEPEAGKTQVEWQAQFKSTAEREGAIAAGTEEVFKIALDALPKIAPLQERQKSKTRSKLSGQAKIERRNFNRAPRLSCLTNPRLKSAEVVCILLHGIGGAATNWIPQLQSLGDNYPLVALDFRGYGQSTLPATPTTIDDYCVDILQLMGAFSAKQVVLCGLSMGAWIATSFCMRYPEKVAGLVVAGGCTGMSEASKEEQNRFLDSRLTPLREGKSPADFADSIVNIIAGPQADAETLEILRASTSDISARTYADALQCFCNPVEQFDFSKLVWPTLLITGEHDRLAPADEIRNVSLRIFSSLSETDAAPQVRFEVLPNSGHVCNLENSLYFNELLAVLLSETINHKSVYRSPIREKKRQQKRQLLLKVIHDEFCAKGFEGTSLNAIAKKAGVSKPTLYQYFGDKESLFYTVLEQGRLHLVAPLLRTDLPLVERLWDFSWNYAEFVLREDMLSLARLVLGEATRRPETAKDYHQHGPGKVLEGITRFIESATKSGHLVTDHPRQTAQALWSLILSDQRDYFLHHVEERPDTNALKQSITRGLEVFLKAFSSHPENDLKKLNQLAEAE